MFYRLNPNYALRGWKGMAWVLVRRPQNETLPLSQSMFQALILCDGQTDLSTTPLDPQLREALDKCEANGYIQSCEMAAPLESWQYYKYYNNRFVQRVFWSITGRCNFRCRHCYMDAPDALLGELSTDEALRLIDEMAACGVLRVDLTGGEPLIRKDLWQIIDRILSHQMVIRQIYSNGWLLNESVLDQLERRNLSPEFSISFDGVGWHDWMRGQPGAEEATLRALQLCRQRGFAVSASMCLHRGNLATLPQTIQALRGVGVDELRISNVDQTDLWRCHSEGNSLTWPEYVDAVLPYIRWYYEARQPIQTLEFGGVAQMQQGRPPEAHFRCYCGNESCLDSYLCEAVRWSCYIAPDGRLLPCMPMTSAPRQDIFPKVQEIGLQKGLSDSFYMQFVNGRIKDLLAVNSECAACDYRYQCGGGCRASALLEGSQQLMGCDRTMCILWKQGYIEKIRAAITEAEAKFFPQK